MYSKSSWSSHTVSMSRHVQSTGHTQPLNLMSKKAFNSEQVKCSLMTLWPLLMKGKQRKEGLVYFQAVLGAVSPKAQAYFLLKHAQTQKRLWNFIQSFSPAQYCLYLVRELWCISQTIRLCFHRVTVRFLLWRGFQNIIIVNLENGNTTV